jgi:ferredoxin
MSDAYVRFEREDLNGIVAVGSYLSDVEKRFGIRPEKECDPANGTHYCEVTLVEGADHLSPLSDAETEHFAKNGRRTDGRLACEAKITKPGDIVIMTDEKRKEAPKKDKFQEEFEALPLEQKITKLFKMEIVTLGETFNYVANSVAEFGTKIEKEVRKATGKAGDNCASEPAAAKGKTAKPKSPPKPPPHPPVG